VVKARVLSAEPIDPTRVIGARVAALRRHKGWTQQDLAEALQAVGIDVERIVIAKLESGRRSFVKVDELLALCVVLEISPTDMLVPRELHDDRYYRVIPKGTAQVANSRRWIAGEDLLFVFHDLPPDAIFADPAKVSDPTEWMPADRAERVAERYDDHLEETDQ
jgi:transcriptional regulator with XRE-family HTH domain